MTKPQAVIFDIGNVLIEWQPERFYDRAIGRERREAMFAAIDLHAMNDKVDRGAHFRETVYAEAELWPDWTPEIRMWHDRWIEMAAPVIDHSVRLLRALRRKGVPVFALSNFGIQTFEIGEANYPFLEEFDRRYISGHMGVIKPEAEIYRMVEEDCGLRPETLLFTDDRADNIAAAEVRGWQTHLFDGPKGWAARLVADGLLDAEDAT
ncbi:HAD family hydrolase [Flavimaricola marinus]|uniref:Alpha-D-glucose-1-phosphate phosphatase YihX n=1 Tax=Flavimaricola marinus TaxID=1819565 RepID=A0A238LHC0_9RHOB|nr:HAD family phosphatase [Flavimaricola marinus]SMY08356.1 Alpha-D-glucose-1-phosphate phosphatase YihX [Flavimaricola marinus]